MLTSRWHAAYCSGMAKTVRAKDVERLARLQASESEAAAFLDIRLTTFRELLRTSESVKNAWKRGAELGKVSLRRKQMRLAEVNASMAIFLGKQMLGQKDVVTQEHTGVDGEPLFDASKLSQRERDELRRLLDNGTGA